MTSDKQAIDTIGAAVIARRAEAWKAEIIESIDRWQKVRGNPFEFRSADRLSLETVVLLLDDRRIPYRIIPLGTGVFKVTTDTQMCTKCRGTGKC